MTERLVLPSLSLLCVLGCAAVQKNEEPMGPPTGEEAGPTIPAGALTIRPDPILVTTRGGEQRVALSVISSTEGDVTRQAQLLLGDGTVGAAQDGALVVRAGLSRGVRTTLTAVLGPQMGQAAVVVRLLAPDVAAEQAPQDPAGYFTGVEGDPRPAWAYPYEGAMLPRSLSTIELQFNGIPGAQLYRVQLDCPTYAQTFYLLALGCDGDRCRFVPPADAWRGLTASCPGETVTLTVTGSPGRGQRIGSAAPVKVRLSPEAIEASLYYSSQQLGGVYRVAGATADRAVYMRNGSGHQCSGCHAVSRDGQRVAATFDGYGGSGGVLDGRNGQRFLHRPPGHGQWYFATFSPRRDMLLVSALRQVWVMDVERGDRLFTVPMGLVGGEMLHPDWSPDGERIAFARAPDGATGYQALNAGDLMVMRFNGGKFSLPEMIVPAKPNAQYHFYPSWTPDSQWILFNTGVVPCKRGLAGCDTFAAQNTLLQIVRAAPGSTPVNLLNARYRAGMSTNWPRAVPAAQAGGRLLFFSFHARLPYGFLGSEERPQIWMSAIDLEKLTTSPGQDPSFTPFWHPGQSLDDSNYLGSWATDLACEAQTDCPAGYDCRGGKCISQVQ